jgi:hypothetical protein
VEASVKSGRIALALLLACLCGCRAGGAGSANDPYDRLGNIYLKNLTRGWINLRVDSDTRYRELQLRVYKDTVEVYRLLVDVYGAEHPIDMGGGFLISPGYTFERSLHKDGAGVRIKRIRLRADALTERATVGVHALPEPDPIEQSSDDG